MSLPSFSDFFSELNKGNSPFPWQSELTDRAVAGKWPDYITTPTGSGKTACLEAAVYALAAQAHLPASERSAPRRIFFIVNRRVIVDEAFARARRMAQALAKPDSNQPACKAIAEALRSLNPITFPHPPLDCVQMRGAIFRDHRWARSILQPTLIATTIDQIGSRLLFRGYGVSPNARPIHAALVATDALWILDEAHISRPFAETVATLQRYREHHLTQNPTAFQPPPLRWMQMTATPPKGAHNTLGLTKVDRDHPVLSRRLTTSKLAQLAISEAKTKAKQHETLAADLLEQAANVIAEYAPRSLAIMVNRVATARLVADLLEKEIASKKARFQATVSLLIGRMRPIDRDAETSRIQSALEKAAKQEPILEGETPPPVEIVVATQCLEVGADLDFDALVTECASLDALRQRFGRLNRTGRDVTARAVIVIPGHLVEPDNKKLDKLTSNGTPLDPIYGNALSATWNWLQTVATEGNIDFGLSPMGNIVETVSESELERLQAPTSSAPSLFPSYLDSWAQTNPAPCPDPDPALFLHGKQTPRPEVLVVWRADLLEGSTPHTATHDVSLCPPSQGEALPVPLHVFHDWFFQTNAKNATFDDTGDLVEAVTISETSKDRKQKLKPLGFALLWRGSSQSRQINSTKDLYAGATIVLPLSLGGWNQLGHIPKTPSDCATLKNREEAPPLTDQLYLDCAEAAFRMSRDRAILRLRPELFPSINGGEAWQELLDYVRSTENNTKPSEVRKLIAKAAEDAELPRALRKTLSEFVDKDYSESRYADDAGIVLTSRRRLGQFEALPQTEDQDDEWSRTTAPAAVTLRTHTKHVSELVAASFQALGINTAVQDCLSAAADLHDWGKLDPRFQALLLGGNPHAAYALAEPLAKSERLPANCREAKRAREQSRLPESFRHEFASLSLATQAEASKLLPSELGFRDLTLHLISSHHGYGRPFAPVVDDTEPPPLRTHRLAGAPALEINPNERTASPAHRLDSGIADRFWRLLRQHGPWSLAFLESTLRLADQQASEAEAEGWYTE